MIAGVFAAAMSTVSSILNSLSAVVVRDLRAFHEDDAQTGMAWARYATLAAGAATPLKAAVQRLDAATEALAARLVEQAMDQALERTMS